MKKIIYIPVFMIVLTLVLSACSGGVTAGKHVHSWERATCETPMICMECGETQGKALNHQWLDATCMAPKTCAGCQKTEGTTLEHQWLDATCAAPKTCTVCQKTEGHALNHKMSAATYNDPPKCSYCGMEEGSVKKPGAARSMKSIVLKVKASSVYVDDDGVEHGPENLYDGDLLTNWAENVSGLGIGEYVMFKFDREYAFKELQIYTGSQYGEVGFNRSSRPKAIRLVFSSDGTFVAGTIDLEDTADMQKFTFDEYIYADTVTVYIEDAYSGNQYLDTIISEMNFVAYLP